MRPVLTIAVHEVRSGLATGRFALAVGVIVAAAMLNLVAGLRDHEARQSRYDQLRTDATQLQAAVPPAPLAPLALGFSDHLERAYAFDPSGATSITAVSRDNLLATPLAAGARTDLLSAVRIFFSLLALLVGAEIVSAERVRGTMRLVLAHPVRRGEVMLGKTIGGLLLALAPLALVLTIAVALLAATGRIEPTGATALRLLVLGAAFMLHQAVFFFAGLVLSILTKKPADSLAAAVLVWAVFVFLVPLCSPVVGRWLVPLPSAEAMQEARVQAWVARMAGAQARNLPDEARRQTSDVSDAETTTAVRDDYDRRYDRRIAVIFRVMRWGSPSGCLIDAGVAAAAVGPDNVGAVRESLLAHERALETGTASAKFVARPRNAVLDVRSAAPGLFGLVTWLGVSGLGSLLLARRLAV